jgi:hypothetical protein
MLWSVVGSVWCISDSLSRNGSFRADARCATTCTARVQATVFAGRRLIRSRLIRRALSPELRVKLKFKFSKGKRRAVRKALKSHRRLRVTINARAKDAAGNPGSAKLKVSLRR